MTQAEQLLLLKRFEPVVRYTAGESFLPLSVEAYLRECSLWFYEEGQTIKLIAAEGKINIENLTYWQVEGLERVNYLKFIEPLNIKQMATYLLKEGKNSGIFTPEFKPSRGRLTRVGFLSRFVDSLFSLSLLARGRVPGDIALAARQTYQRMMHLEPRYQYYARVVENAGWMALQYWYFYPFNNWRSGFKGANDHEGDWEMITVYLYRNERNEWLPEWVACSNHDYEGDDLRRHWQDPELETIDFHPVIYVGAGSHAHYFTHGEYLAEVGIPFLTRVNGWLQSWKEFWRRAFSYQRVGPGARTNQPFFRIPFIDYARGDGMSIGYNQPRQWDTPIIIDPAPDWVMYYHGLWGFYARDPAAGENAPAGPRFNRNGTVRRAWYDPFGWVGLDKVPPPPLTRQYLEMQLHELDDQQKALSEQIAQFQVEQYKDGVQLQAIHDRYTTNTQLPAITSEVEGQFSQLRALKKKMSSNDLLRENLIDELANMHKKKPRELRSHLIRPPVPEKPMALRHARLAEFWAAVSMGVMAVGLVALVMFARQYLVYGALTMLLLLFFIEASFRRQTFQFIYVVTVLLAIFATGILMVEFFWPILLVLIFAASIYVMWQNIREL